MFPIVVMYDLIPAPILLRFLQLCGCMCTAIFQAGQEWQSGDKAKPELTTCAGAELLQQCSYLPLPP